ncbi:butyrophilin subfamily 3 member A1-like [Trachemys scripta elegans]|uniref:butyrophilin subfamily 3 member A1-like n=1 Tax=Trachemys scripta elegans TaxID=31138 RepID=UPI0015562B77|nr:butyrophilin subfamily 3 member A1-like [Trachemys scripta elegans]
MAMRWRLCVCSLGILLLAPCSLSEKFSLASSPRPVVGVVGRDVVLPCQLSPPARLPSMEVLWRKTGSGFIPVHKYSDEGTQDLPGEGYQTRTELFPQEFSSGNVSLKLKWLQVVDDGKYQCLVRNPEWTQEATIELRVAAVAPVFIDVLGPRGQGIGLACRTTGWFPKPKLQWVGKNWQNLAMESVTDMTQDRENLYSVVSHVTVTEGEENGDISCIVRNGLLETEQRSAIHLSGDIFPWVSPWLAAFWILFTLVLIAAGACAYLGYTAKRKASRKKRSKEDALLLLAPQETEKKTLEAERHELHKTIDKAVRELDFRRARSYMVCVTLDPDCKHPELTISKDGRRIQHDPASLGLATPPGALVAVGREGFVARKDHDGEGGACRGYWEVEVGDRLDWELGVLSKTVRGRVKQERLEKPHEGGCWALGRSEGQYYPREADTVIQNLGVRPTVVGVYLDLEGGSISFYSVNSMARILEIPVEGSERLFPFLSPGHAAGRDQRKPLSICPPSDWDFPQKLGVSGSVSQEILEPLPRMTGKGQKTTQSDLPQEKEAPSPGQHPAPGDKQVKKNRARPSVGEHFQKLLPTKWRMEDKTEQVHQQLETPPRQKGGKNSQNSQV